MHLTIRLADTDLVQYLKQVWPVLAGLARNILLIAFIPQIVTFLPDLIMGPRMG
jgi:TRAP-type C4-dicarboxylate transport system permease large subunit